MLNPVQAQKVLKYYAETLRLATARHRPFFDENDAEFQQLLAV